MYIIAQDVHTRSLSLWAKPPHVRDTITHFFIENNPTSNNKYFLQIYRRWAKPVYVRDTITWYGRLARLTALPATPHDKQDTYHQFTFLVFCLLTTFFIHLTDISKYIFIHIYSSY